ncbi:SulP family inorganic anion transporter [Rhodopirellula sp. MGV]|uniref:SulP family inorganic anion transporter n=1 Tax=Rhodopirellula sp. MGV TaxID=2023130 RepID=UPI000B97A49E|nr:SulP family inorganic anion transporter [Rhodopirellula sp. MGV]OYP35027.1 sulfate permease [Rhodopirellula sp. MGV]PNY35807.1 SulP family inorganic anion transporter [Rhodopirellula baltica]
MLNFFRRHSANTKDDLLSGLTVALALVPEAVAFAFVAGVSPLIGLYSAVFLGLITAILGGRPGMISGATGAMAVVVVGLVTMHGIEYMFPAVILCGIIQIVIGFARLGKLIRMVPHSVMLGFVNGLAIVIGMAQLGSFKVFDLDTAEMVYLSGVRLWLMLGLVGLTMLIIVGLPKFTKAIPASLAAILVVTLISVGINRSGQIAGDGISSNAIATVGDMLATHATAATAEEQLASGQEIVPVEASIGGGLPMPFFMEYMVPEFSLETLKIIFPFALTLAGVGLIESLMTLTLIDEITETRGRGNRECVGQGVANLLCGFFGGMGGCAMIGQSLINVNSGGRGRLSGITAACCLMLFILFVAPWIEMIPMAALVGVMFMVVIGTFEWASLKMINRIPPSDYFVMVLVAGYTVVMHDLATAVILGVVVSACVFAWQHATHLGADTRVDEEGTKVYQLHGPLYFASASSFKELFDVQNDPEDVVIDFYYTRVYDQSGMEAIKTLTEKYEAANKKLHLTHLSQECRTLLDRAGEFVEVNLSEDPQYHVATDRLG